MTPANLKQLLETLTDYSGLPPEKIFTHPANISLIRQLVIQSVDNAPELSGQALFGLEVVADRHLPPDQPSGRYHLPDGRTVPLAEVRVPWGPFCELDHRDLQTLLAWGLVREEREPLFYMVRFPALRFDLELLPRTVRPPRHFITGVW